MSLNYAGLPTQSALKLGNLKDNDILRVKSDAVWKAYYAAQTIGTSKIRKLLLTVIRRREQEALKSGHLPVDFKMTANEAKEIFPR